MKNTSLIRNETWGNIIYNFEEDSFSSTLIKGQQPIPSSPIGIAWVIIGGCNLKCIHCYGNAEELSRVVLSTNEAFQIVDKIIESRVMRVVICGGEPLLRDDIFDIIERLVHGGVSVVLGTNGSFVTSENVQKLKICTRVEISLDGSTAESNNKIRPSRQKNGNAWQETFQAIKLCLKHNVKLRVLTAINAQNQHEIVQIATNLNKVGVSDWALSWTIPAGRARFIFDKLRPTHEIVEENVNLSKSAYPNMVIRYSHRSETFSRFYCLILPDGQIGTEDFAQGTKLMYGSLLEQSIESIWNAENYNLQHHFEKWVGKNIV
jgi:MoaA/NifB/PqqE/SkfB family radical SAM enzyme